MRVCASPSPVTTGRDESPIGPEVADADDSDDDSDTDVDEDDAELVADDDAADESSGPFGVGEPEGLASAAWSPLGAGSKR